MGGGEFDAEAVAWAYRKLMDFGCYASEDGAMMGDRLNLMLLNPPAEVQGAGGGDVSSLPERWRTVKRDLSAVGCANELQNALSAQPRPETDDSAAWLAALTLPDGYDVHEHLPGIWEHRYTGTDGEQMVSGTSWNHPALAAIAAWEAVTQQPRPEGAPVGVEELVREMEVFARKWRTCSMSELEGFTRRLRAALAQQAPVASSPVGECPDCTNGQQCDSCSRGERAVLESSAPVGMGDVDLPEPEGFEKVVREAVAAWGECRSPLAAQEAMYRITNDLRANEAVRAQQPAPDAPVGAYEIVALALDEQGHHTEADNVRKGIDLQVYRTELAAVRIALAQQPAATLPDEDDSDLTVAYMAGRHDGRKESRQPAAVDEATASRILTQYLANDPGDLWPPERQVEMRVKALQDAINNTLAQPQGASHGQ